MWPQWLNLDERQDRPLLTAYLAPRWCKVVRDLTHNKTRTMLVVMSIALGVMCIGMISRTRLNLLENLQGAYLATNPYHAILATDEFDGALVRAVRRSPAIGAAEGRQVINARLRLGPEQWQDLQLIALANFHDIPINQLTLVAGSWPPPKGSLLLERASWAATGMALHEKVQVQLPDGQARSLKISGAVHDLSQPPALFSGQLYGYITLETLTFLGWAPTFNELTITVAEPYAGREQILAVTAAVKEQIERSGRAVHADYVPEPGEHWSYDSIQAMVFLLTALGLLALLLSGFLVTNTISALLLEQVRQIGVMKALGAHRGQLTGLYLGTVCLYGLLALCIALPLGIWGAQLLTNLVAGLLNFDVVGFTVAPQIFLLEIGAGLLTPLLAATIPVLKGARVTVQAAINDYGVGSGSFGSAFLDRMINRVRGLPRPVLLSLRNTFRQKGRLLLVMATLTLASAIFVSVLSVQASLTHTVDDALRYWQYDVNLRFDRPHRTAVLTDEALRVPGVVGVEGWGFAPVVRLRTTADAIRNHQPTGAVEQSDSLFLMAPPADTTFIDPLVIEGRWLLPEDGRAVVINTDVLNAESDLRVGDELVLRIAGEPTIWRIVGLVDQPLSGPFLYVNYDAYVEDTGDWGRVSDIRVATATHSEEAQLQMAQQLETHFESKGYKISTIVTTGQERAEMESTLNIIVLFLLIMAVLLALVGGLGLMGVMSMNVLERTREFGIMRAIGAANGAVMQIVLIEGVVIGLLSWLGGVGLAWPLGKLLSDQVGLLFLGVQTSYIYADHGAWLWLSMMTVIAALASYLPARRATRLTVQTSLAYQ
jgi:putative ABC transport system permease protein